MTRRSREVGIIKSCVLGGALAVGMALPAHAQDKKLELSATASFTTDYIFRGISNSDENPAVQPSFNAAYGMFYAGIWGSNTDFGDGIEIDYYAGIAPTWKNFTFDIGGLYYSFPGFSSIDYFELKTGIKWAGGNWTLVVNNYWSPDYSGLDFDSNATDGTVTYAFNGKLFNFFSPSVSAQLGYQSYEDLLADYTYWNAGLTLGFMEKWSADIRYWDTSYSDSECGFFLATPSGVSSGCDARVVGTLSATF
jgi:uncharacterized protein (TIGR02001 family)